jgi:hypothetical protein
MGADQVCPHDLALASQSRVVLEPSLSQYLCQTRKLLHREAMPVWRIGGVVRDGGRWAGGAWA